MKRLRTALSYTLYPVFLALVALGWSFHQLARTLMWLSMTVIRLHVVFPIVLLRRMIAGQPIWKPGDLAIGVLPDSKRARAAAAAAGYIEVPICACGKPECENAGIVTWTHKDQYESQLAMQKMANQFLDDAKAKLGINGVGASFNFQPPNSPPPP